MPNAPRGNLRVLGGFRAGVDSSCDRINTGSIVWKEIRVVSEMLVRHCLQAVATAAIIASSAIAQEPAVEPRVTGPNQLVQQDQKEDTSESESREFTSPLVEIRIGLEHIDAAIRDLGDRQIAERVPLRDEYDKRDLEAQESMASWAQAVFWTSLAAVALTLIGVVLISLTLHHTRRAADYAKDMVDEAKNATRAANDTFAEAKRANDIVNIDRRPWVAIQSIESQGFQINDQSGNFSAVLGLFNHGPVAATHIRAVVRVHEMQQRPVDIFDISISGSQQEAERLADIVSGVGIFEKPHRNAVLYPSQSVPLNIYESLAAPQVYEMRNTLIYVFILIYYGVDGSGPFRTTAGGTAEFERDSVPASFQVAAKDIRFTERGEYRSVS